MKNLILLPLYLLLFIYILKMPAFAAESYPSVEGETITSFKNSEVCDNTIVLMEEEKTINKVYDDIICETTISLIDNFEDQNNKGVFIKSVKANEAIVLKKTGEVISNQLLYIRYHYDGSSVWIENMDADVVSNQSNYDKHFVTTGAIELFESDSQSIVSGTWVIYKKRTGGIHYKYYNNSHIDFVCTPNGEISYNLKTGN